jgi:Anti-sigma-K factor rskA
MHSEQPPRSPQRAGWWTALWAIAAITCLAMALFAAAFFRGRETDLMRELALAREQLRAQSIEFTRLNEALATLRAPNTLVTSFGGNQRPQGAVFVSASQGTLLVAYDLPPAAPGKVYEMWVVPKHGMPEPAGMFYSTADNTALNVHKGAVDLAATRAVEVTLENEGGAPQPTSAPLILATL